jgi:glutaconate CoA-transferase, subunit A
VVTDNAKRRQDKVTTLSMAIRTFVQNGNRVAMGLCLESLIPFAAGHEFIRQNETNLTWIGPISGILFAQLVGAGCAKEIIAAWVGKGGAGMGYNFRRAMEQNLLRPVLTRNHSNFIHRLSSESGSSWYFLPTDANGSEW